MRTVVFVRTLESQSPQTGQFNSYPNKLFEKNKRSNGGSQSPQTGQFNSYGKLVSPYFKRVRVSIPSNGSIQFLLCYRKWNSLGWIEIWSQSPQTGQFNSYTNDEKRYWFGNEEESQSPQTGQFNSYPRRMKMCVIRCYSVSIPSNGSIQFLLEIWDLGSERTKRSQSPQTGQFNSYKRAGFRQFALMVQVSIPSNGSIQFLLK